MPGRLKSKKLVRKPMRRIRRFNKRPIIRSKLATGMPTFYHTKLKYVESIKSTLTTGVTSVYQFRLGSLYDPNVTGTGHQPMWRDFFIQAYAYYKVLGVGVKIRAISETNPSSIILDGTNDLSTYTDLTTVQENRRVKPKTVGISNPVVFSKYYSLPEVLQVKKRTYMTDKRYNTAVGADPSDQSFLNIYTRTFDPFVNSVVAYTIELTYYTRFNDVIQQSSS